jgi:hypothetical protein
MKPVSPAIGSAPPRQTDAQEFEQWKAQRSAPVLEPPTSSASPGPEVHPRTTLPELLGRALGPQLERLGRTAQLGAQLGLQLAVAPLRWGGR